MKPELKKELSELYLQGSSLRKLSSKYNIPKTTIYYNLSKDGFVRRHSIIRGLKSKNEFILGTFIGLWAGDGSKFLDTHGGYTIKIHLNKNDKILIEFINFLYTNMFQKKTILSDDGSTTNKASVKIYSKFVYNFIDEYIYHNRNKTYSVKLKPRKMYSKKFLKGFLLGLILSDGYLKKDFVFTSVSKGLTRDIVYILKDFRFEVKKSIVKNRDWMPVNLVRIGRKEVPRLNKLLDSILKLTGFEKSFMSVKYSEV